MIKFDVYVQRKEGGVIKSQKLEWCFNRIIDCLHYAIDNFDRKSNVKMTICKGNKTIMTFTNLHNEDVSTIKLLNKQIKE